MIFNDEELARIRASRNQRVRARTFFVVWALFVLFVLAVLPYKSHAAELELSAGASRGEGPPCALGLWCETGMPSKTKLTSPAWAVGVNMGAWKIEWLDLGRQSIDSTDQADEALWRQGAVTCGGRFHPSPGNGPLCLGFTGHSHVEGLAVLWTPCHGALCLNAGMYMARVQSHIVATPANFQGPATVFDHPDRFHPAAILGVEYRAPRASLTLGVTQLNTQGSPPPVVQKNMAFLLLGVRL